MLGERPHNAIATAMASRDDGNDAENHLAPILYQSRDPEAIRRSRELEYTTKEEADTLLAQEMKKLSIKQRERVHQDVYGVAEKIKETPKLIADSIRQLREAIESIPSTGTHKKCYNLALSMNPEYVTSRKLSLMFLRANDFKIDKTAASLVSHFRCKRELFGTEYLTKDYDWDHLNKDDIACLKNGHAQLLPSRDRSGRAILFISLAHQRYKRIANQLRALGYILWKALQDEETQKKGMVIVAYSVGDPTRVDFDPAFVMAGAQFSTMMPFRISGFHHCYSSPLLRPFAFFHRKVFPSHTRFRSREHEGSHLECLYQLMTFGIPTDSFPITSDGTLLRDRHEEWLQSLQRSEAAEDTVAAQSNTNSILVPTRDDVLFGRMHATHVGNYNFNQLVEDWRIQYDVSTRLEKTELAKQIVVLVKARSGRFLRMEKGVWGEVDDEVARKRVSQSFRSQRRMDSPETSSRTEAAAVKTTAKAAVAETRGKRGGTFDEVGDGMRVLDSDSSMFIEDFGLDDAARMASMLTSALQEPLDDDLEGSGKRAKLDDMEQLATLT